VTELNLSYNRLGLGCCESIADMLKVNKTLLVLDLLSNQQEDSGVKIFYAEKFISMNKTLISVSQDRGCAAGTCREKTVEKGKIIKNLFIHS